MLQLKSPLTYLLETIVFSQNRTNAQGCWKLLQSGWTRPKIIPNTSQGCSHLRGPVGPGPPTFWAG